MRSTLRRARRVKVNPRHTLLNRRDWPRSSQADQKNLWTFYGDVLPGIGNTPDGFAHYGIYADPTCSKPRLTTDANCEPNYDPNWDPKCYCNRAARASTRTMRVLARTIHVVAAASTRPVFCDFRAALDVFVVPREAPRFMPNLEAPLREVVPARPFFGARARGEFSAAEVLTLALPGPA